MTEQTTHPIDFIAPVDDEERSRGLAALGVILIRFTCAGMLLLLSYSN